MSRGQIGMLATPAEGRDPGALRTSAVDENGTPIYRPARKWAGDNGCFGVGYPGDQAWFTWLRRHAGHIDRCLFAAAPDVVGDATATLARSTPWLPRIRQLGYPAALVGQNGLTSDMVPWNDFDVLFLGGSAECLPCHYIKPIEDRKRTQCPACFQPLREWKLSEQARWLAREAKRRGKGLHMGRVNSGRRWRYAEFIGCDTADGTFLAKGPDKNLARMSRWNRDSGADGLFDADEVSPVERITLPARNRRESAS